MKPLDVAGIDLRLRRRRERGVKPTLYDGKLVIRRARLLSDFEEVAYRMEKQRAIAAKVAAAESATEAAILAEALAAAEAVAGFLEAGMTLLDSASAVTEEDGADVAEVLSILGSWWPPAAREQDDAEPANVFEFPPSPGDVPT